MNIKISFLIIFFLLLTLVPLTFYFLLSSLNGEDMSKIFEALQKAEQAQGQDQGSVAIEDVALDLDISDELVVLGRPGSAAAEQFRYLRALITRPTEGEVTKTVLVTSSLQGEGKTFTACNLAVTIAQGLEEHVLLVDADLRNPRLHKIFGLQNKDKGLSTHLAQGEPLPNLLCKTGIHKLTILPAGLEAKNPAEVLSSERMKHFIAEVRDRYADRLVIFDSSPVQLAPETMVVANEVDGIFLLVYRGHTPREAVQNTIERFKQDTFKGIIFNGYEHHSHKKYQKNGYGYGYGYGYGKKERGEEVKSKKHES